MNYFKKRFFRFPSIALLPLFAIFALQRPFLDFATLGSIVLNPDLAFPKQVFLGLVDPAKKPKVFQWVDNSPLNYTNWQPGQPDDFGGNQFCGTIVTSLATNAFYKNWTVGKWDDVDCSLPYDGICQMTATRQDEGFEEPTTIRAMTTGKNVQGTTGKIVQGTTIKNVATTRNFFITTTKNGGTTGKAMATSPTPSEL